MLRPPLKLAYQPPAVFLSSVTGSPYRSGPPAARYFASKVPRLKCAPVVDDQ
jgi:hypothetical protein